MCAHTIPARADAECRMNARHCTDGWIWRWEREERKNSSPSLFSFFFAFAFSALRLSCSIDLDSRGGGKGIFNVNKVFPSSSLSLAKNDGCRFAPTTSTATKKTFFFSPLALFLFPYLRESVKAASTLSSFSLSASSIYRVPLLPFHLLSDLALSV